MSQRPFWWSMHSLCPVGSQARKLAERVTETALQKIQRGTLAIASMPIAAVRCMSLLRTPDFSLREAADVISADPVLAARVLSVSNSAGFGLGRIRTLVQAVTRLGVENLRLVLFEATAAGIFTSNDSRIRVACARLWEHSRAVAASSRRISLMVGVGDPGEAYLAGLLHDLGKPIVASMLLKPGNQPWPDTSWLEPEIWLAIVHHAHRPVGAAVARRWDLPQTITQAIENRTEPGCQSSPILTCVQLANALAKDAGIYVGAFDSDEVDVILHDGQGKLGLDDSDLAALRAELGESIRSAGLTSLG